MGSLWWLLAAAALLAFGVLYGKWRVPRMTAEEAERSRRSGQRVLRGFSRFQALIMAALSLIAAIGAAVVLAAGAWMVGILVLVLAALAGYAAWYSWGEFAE